MDPKLVAAHYGRVHIQPELALRNAGGDGVVQSGWTYMTARHGFRVPHVDIGADESDGTIWSFAPVVFG